MGFLGSLGSALGNFVGGELPQVTQQIHDARQTAFNRMLDEARKHKASASPRCGWSDASRLAHRILFTGSCVHDRSDDASPFFTSSGNAQELYCHMDAGYQPLAHVFGNIAYSIGLGGGLRCTSTISATT
jgi:hypothetical protein